LGNFFLKGKTIMQWTTYLSIGLFQAVITAITWFCASYLKEKGKNFATREDIKEITDKIESVKTEYAKELEGLKSQLNAKFHAQTVRFEKEFNSYKEIWDSIVELMEHIFEFHIAVSTSDRKPELNEASKKRFLQAIQDFYFAFEKSRPFFSPEVYEVIVGLRHLEAIEELIKYSYLPAPSPEQSGNIKRLLDELLIGPADELMKKTDAIEEAIRSRVKSF